MAYRNSRDAWLVLLAARIASLSVSIRWRFVIHYYLDLLARFFHSLENVYIVYFNLKMNANECNYVFFEVNIGTYRKLNVNAN